MCFRPNVYKTVNTSTSGWKARCRYAPIHNNSILFIYVLEWIRGENHTQTNHFIWILAFTEMQTTRICTCAIQSPRWIVETSNSTQNHNNAVQAEHPTNICVAHNVDPTAEQTIWEKLRRLPMLTAIKIRMTPTFLPSAPMKKSFKCDLHGTVDGSQGSTCD